MCKHARLSLVKTVCTDDLNQYFCNVIACLVIVTCSVAFYETKHHQSQVLMASASDEVELPCDCAVAVLLWLMLVVSVVVAPIHCYSACCFIVCAATRKSASQRQVLVA